ncbi:hypothetical protein ACFL12_01160 [Pseudomonadota bacterium]
MDRLWLTDQNNEWRYVALQYDVSSVVVLPGRIIAALDWSVLKECEPNEDWCRNVWCFDYDGKVLWKIQRPIFRDPDNPDKLIDNIDDPYTSVFVSDDGEIGAAGRNRFVIDSETGEISKLLGAHR